MTMISRKLVPFLALFILLVMPPVWARSETVRNVSSADGDISFLRKLDALDSDFKREELMGKGL